MSVDPNKKLHSCTGGKESRVGGRLWVRSPRTGNRVYLEDWQRFALSHRNPILGRKLSQLLPDRIRTVLLTSAEALELVEASKQQLHGMLMGPRTLR